MNKTHTALAILQLTCCSQNIYGSYNEVQQELFKIGLLLMNPVFFPQSDHSLSYHLLNQPFKLLTIVSYSTCNIFMILFHAFTSLVKLFSLHMKIQLRYQENSYSFFKKFQMTYVTKSPSYLHLFTEPLMGICRILCALLLQHFPHFVPFCFFMRASPRDFTLGYKQNAVVCC